MEMAMQRGRPRKYGPAMRKTSIALPDELVAALKVDSEKSGFRHWSEQARCELMTPRGMWRPIKPYLPGQDGPQGKA
jgi:hypothetical protein